MSYGDKILIELHETRSDLSRLAEIEKQLENMKNKVQDEEAEEVKEREREKDIYYYYYYIFKLLTSIFIGNCFIIR